MQQSDGKEYHHLTLLCFCYVMQAEKVINNAHFLFFSDPFTDDNLSSESQGIYY